MQPGLELNPDHVIWVVVKTPLPVRPDWPQIKIPETKSVKTTKAAEP